MGVSADLFDRALLKIGSGAIDLDTMAIKAILCGSSQSLGRSFVGSSGDARYADITGELSTANGYTAGGLALTSVALTRVTASKVKFSSDDLVWTITSTGLAALKYCVFVVDGATNDDLLYRIDLEDTGGTVAVSAGSLQISMPSNGWFTWEQP